MQSQNSTHGSQKMSAKLSPLRLAIVLNQSLVVFSVLLMILQLAWNALGSWLYIPLLLGCVAFFTGSAFVARSQQPTRHLLLAVIVGNTPFLCYAAYVLFHDVQALKFTYASWPMIFIFVGLFTTSLVNISVSGLMLMTAD